MKKKKYTIEDFLSRGWFIRTSSTFFKNGILPAKPPEWVYNFPYRYDTIMHVFLGSAGHALYIDEPMSIWRKHMKGMSLKLRENISKNILTEIAMTTKLDNHTNYKYTQHAKKNIAELHSHLFLNLLKVGNGSFNILLFIRSMIYMNWGSSFKRLKNRFLK